MTMEESRKSGEELDAGQLARDGKLSAVTKIPDDIFTFTTFYCY